MEAASVGDTALCAQLIAAGADPRLKDNIGRTAADIARQSEHNECATALEATR